MISEKKLTTIFVLFSSRGPAGLNGSPGTPGPKGLNVRFTAVLISNSVMNVNEK